MLIDPPGGRAITDDQSLYWWIDHIATVASIPLALVGFGVTLWQLIKTRSAANAAFLATVQMRQQIRRTNLASLLPQLSRIEDEIDRAVSDRSLDGLRFWIATWRWQASEIRTYLIATDGMNQKTLRSVQASISIAADTRREMHDVSDPEMLISLTDALRKAVGRVTGELGAIAAQQVMETGGHTDGTS